MKIAVNCGYFAGYIITFLCGSFIGSADVRLLLIGYVFLVLSVVVVVTMAAQVVRLLQENRDLWNEEALDAKTPTLARRRICVRVE